MTLPDLSRLSASPGEKLRGFAGKLQALGVSLEAAAPIALATRSVPGPLVRPVRAFHLRRRRDPCGYAMRMFVYADPVTLDEARATFGGDLDWLVEVGLLTKLASGDVVSPFILSIADDLYVLSDDLAQGDDAVMGFGKATIELAAAGYPRGRLGRVLDLGCGSGTAGLVLARRAQHVVATDINPRAVALAKINAAMNGASNFEVREGDLFAPVAGDVFDLVVSQPPFVPQPEGVGAAQFLYGGRRGDEITLALLGDLVKHLTPTGRAILFVEWPDDGAQPIAQRLRRALGSAAANVLLLQMPETSLDAHAAMYAAGLHPTLGEAFEDEVRVRREHFDAVGIRALVPSFTIVQRSGGAGGGWTHTLDVLGVGAASFTSERIDRLIRARAVVADRERLLAANVRVPDGTVFAQEQVGPGADVASTLGVRFAPAALITPAPITEQQLGVLTSTHEAATVRAGIASFASDIEAPIDDAMAALVPEVEQALLRGWLELVDA